MRALIPPHVLAENREIAARAADRPVSRTAMAVIILIWLAAAAAAADCGLRVIRRHEPPL